MGSVWILQTSWWLIHILEKVVKKEDLRCSWTTFMVLYSLLTCPCKLHRVPAVEDLKSNSDVDVSQFCVHHADLLAYDMCIKSPRLLVRIPTDVLMVLTI